ncbi:tRNA threonylcarbamoyladenosine biosynthesis protein TsaE [Campylobacterota bacterium]|nr:tRNA threonylcarbamoyladenosine biosynthesis protein TsaE [Campylobacterota bacterium]
MKQVTIASVEEFDTICSELIAQFPNGVIVLLRGALGSGKTAFVKRFARQFGIDDAASPSFGIMHQYAPNLTHIDLYRVGSAEFFARGLAESLFVGWAFVEWADEAIERYLREEQTPFTTVSIALEGERRVVSYE